jgi:hypothetical protein
LPVPGVRLRFVQTTQPKKAKRMTGRSDIQLRRLAGLERVLGLLLTPALRQCAAGRWGLFGQNDHLEASQYRYWVEAELLKNIARQIRLIRQGQSDPLVERFLYYCSLRGANVPGEPKLAQELLDEVKYSPSATKPKYERYDC